MMTTNETRSFRGCPPGKAEKHLTITLSSRILTLILPVSYQTLTLTLTLDAKGELIKSSPPNVSFEGIPVNFSYCDGKKIKNRICEKYEEFLLDPEPDVVFCFGCYVAPYYCSVNSTWVYVGKMRDLEELDDDEEA